MESLPRELLNNLFSNLCYHCQFPNRFPNADIPETRMQKKSLAYLCRASRFIGAAAQPFLYHYYATGNLLARRVAKNPYGIEETVLVPEEYDFLPEFLHTISRNPELASNVESMQVVDTVERNYYGEENVAFQSLVDLHSTKRIIHDVEGHYSYYTAQAPADQDEGVLMERSWLIMIALEVAPHLKKLLIKTSNSKTYTGNHDTCDIRIDPSKRFPQLRELALLGNGFPYGFFQPDGLGTAFSNLETLYSAEAWDKIEWFMARGQEHGLDKPLTILPKLKKLVLSNFSHPLLSRLVTHLPELQDLEIYVSWHSKFTFNHSTIELPQHLHKTLKRLCVGGLCPKRDKKFYRQEQELAQRVQEHGFLYMFMTPPDKPPLDLRAFTALTDVSIDCTTLYDGNQDDEPDRLVRFLPPSIERLRITHVCRDIGNALSELAMCADFPRLREVVIGIAEEIHPTEEHYERLERIKKAGEGFVGFRYSWKIDPCGAIALTMVPGTSVVHEEYVPVPRVVDEGD